MFPYKLSQRIVLDGRIRNSFSLPPTCPFHLTTTTTPLQQRPQPFFSFQHLPSSIMSLLQQSPSLSVSISIRRLQPLHRSSSLDPAFQKSAPNLRGTPGPPPQSSTPFPPLLRQPPIPSLPWSPPPLPPWLKPSPPSSHPLLSPSDHATTAPLSSCAAKEPAMLVAANQLRCFSKNSAVTYAI